MRKTITIIMILLAVMTVSAQEPILIDGNMFQESGSMNMYWESENTDDISKADDGARWHIEKNGQNTITFWIDLPQQGLYQLSKTTWNDAALIMEKPAEDRKIYSVHDDQFRHLAVIEYDKGKYLVQLCSILHE